MPPNVKSNYLAVFQTDEGQMCAYSVPADKKSTVIRVVEHWMEELGSPVSGEVVVYTSEDLRDLADGLDHNIQEHDIPPEYIPGC